MIGAVRMSRLVSQMDAPLFHVMPQLAPSIDIREFMSQPVSMESLPYFVVGQISFDG
ncbi:hypothetical protein D9M68_479820 [compost metagenome]